MNESKFNMSSVTEFLSVLNEIEKNTDAKTLVVRSSDEKLWSTGLDLEWLTPLVQKGERSVADAFTAKLVELFKTILFYPMITVAAITGHAFAGGAVMACCFDFRFMRKGRGYFCFPEVDLGIPFIPSFTALMKKAIPIANGNIATGIHPIASQGLDVKNGCMSYNLPPKLGTVG
jgi:enoyl-CoA hydratase/carnithine racemase